MAQLDDSDIGLSVSNLKILDGSGAGYTVRLEMDKLMSSMGLAGAIPAKEMKQLSAIMDAAMGGEVGMQIRYFHEGNKVAMVAGRNGKMIGRAKQLLREKDTGAPNTLTSLTTTAQGSPTMAMAMDVRKLASDLISFLHTVPEIADEMGDVPHSVPEGAPVEVTAISTAMQKGGQCVISLDVGSLAQMMNSLEEAQKAKHSKQAAMAN
jgi:hypothetical protein